MITETVLEMHYHRPILDAFRATLGVGSWGCIEFYKYSPQKECFVGFDQAYVKSQLSEEELFSQLEKAAKSDAPSLGDLFLGYFLQFKVVRVMRRRGRHTPVTVTSVPHYRVALDTTKNATTGLSQHEMLHNLNKNAGAMVYYACPMLFDRESLYEIDVDLESLRLVDLDSCPSRFADNDQHFVFFDDVAAQPVWCSEPVEGTATSLTEFIDRAVRERLEQRAASELALQLLMCLTGVESVGLKVQPPVSGREKRRTLLPFVGHALTIVKVSQANAR